MVHNIGRPLTQSYSGNAESNVRRLTKAPQTTHAPFPLPGRLEGGFPVVPPLASASLTHGPALSCSTNIDMPAQPYPLIQPPIIYSDTVDFGQRALDPTISLLALDVLRAELRSVIDREQKEREEINARKEERESIWQGIIERLRVSIDSLMSQEGQETSGNGDSDRGQLIEDGATGNAQPETGELMGQQVN